MAKESDLELLKRRMSSLEKSLKEIEDRMEKLYENSSKIDIIHAKTTEVARDLSTFSAALKTLSEKRDNDFEFLQERSNVIEAKWSAKIETLVSLIESGENLNGGDQSGVLFFTTAHQTSLHRLRECKLSEAIQLQKENPSYTYLFMKSLKNDEAKDAENEEVKTSISYEK